MATIDSRVLELLAPLQRSPLASLGQLAIERITSAEDDRHRDGDEPDPAAPKADENSITRAQRQLNIADKVVSSVLKRELSLLERLQKLRREFDFYSGGSTADGGSEQISSIFVVGAEGEEAEDLITGARRRPLEALLEKWTYGVGMTAARIEQGGA